MDQLPLETSDEASSDSDMLDRSLSIWEDCQESLFGDDTFDPIPFDMHTAASLGDYDCVKDYLTRSCVNKNRRNNGGWTPLMYASCIGHNAIVNLLLDAKTDVNIKTVSGNTALMIAASYGNENVVYLLYQHGADSEDCNNRGWTALFHATYSGHQNVVHFLVESGMDPNREDNELGITPLMLAAAEGHSMIVSILLEKGVNVGATNQNGHTARTLALINGYMNVVAVIDNITMSPSSLQSSLDLDFSSSDESFHPPKRHHHRKTVSTKVRGPSIEDGPALFAKLRVKKHDVTDPSIEDGPALFAKLRVKKHDVTKESNRANGQPTEKCPDLASLLENLNLKKYKSVFEEQEVDLQVFLSLTDNDLKEVGIKLMGPRRKMTNAITRWHSKTKTLSSNLEQVYTDRMETALQEMAVQYEEMLVKKEELNAQEHELQSMVEGCVVDDPKSYQQILRHVTDTRSLCHKMGEMYENVRFMQAELLMRLQNHPSPSSTMLLPETPQNLEIGFILDTQFPPSQIISAYTPLSNITAPPDHGSRSGDSFSQHGEQGL